MKRSEQNHYATLTVRPSPLEQIATLTANTDPPAHICPLHLLLVENDIGPQSIWQHQ